MTIEIDKARALQLLEEAVAERGADYVYDDSDIGCVYVTKDGTPACGVGLALTKAGVPLELLTYIDHNGDGAGGKNRFEETQIDSPDLLDYLRQNDVDIDDKAEAVFRRFQFEQDHATPWGEALAEAREQDGV
jgi:hypothetical protein